MKYKNIICYIFFKVNSQSFIYITTREYSMILNVFNVANSIHNFTE